MVTVLSSWFQNWIQTVDPRLSSQLMRAEDVTVFVFSFVDCQSVKPFYCGSLSGSRLLLTYSDGRYAMLFAIRAQNTSHLILKFQASDCAVSLPHSASVGISYQTWGVLAPAPA